MCACLVLVWEEEKKRKAKKGIFSSLERQHKGGGGQPQKSLFFVPFVAVWAWLDVIFLHLQQLSSLTPPQKPLEDLLVLKEH